MFGSERLSLGRQALMMAVAWAAAASGAAVTAQEAGGEHPLLPVVRMAQDRLAQIDREIRDYKCILIKRERIDDVLSDYEFLQLKLRHERRQDGQVVVPMSVYVHYLRPREVEGREAIFVEGRNAGRIIARRGGLRHSYMTLSLDPASGLAMNRSRYPITEIGIANMLKRLIEVGQEDLQHGECEVRYRTGARLDGRSCTVIEVEHPVRRPYFRYHLAQIFVDDEWRLPIRFASYDWPAQAGDEPPLLEEYTYRNLEFNCGLTDWDFDHRNEQYGFWKDFKP